MTRVISPAHQLTLDCPEIRGPLDDGRVVVRGDKPDAVVLAELNLPDHEGAVIVPPSLVLGVREVLTLTWWDAHPRYHRDTPVA